MIDLAAFASAALPGGFRITEIHLSSVPLVDAIGREAVAQTTIRGREFSLLVRAGLAESELSVTLYHEILEAASVASPSPPASVVEFNEGDFERAAEAMHAMLGTVSPDNLGRMLRHFRLGE